MTKKAATSNTRVNEFKNLQSPQNIINSIKASKKILGNVLRYRQTIDDLLAGRDKRLLVIVGPCSIHDTEACYEYAKKLKVLAKAVEDRYFIVMRVYFEKPRTTIGWKGMINDPNLDGSCDIEAGIKKAREFLVSVANLGLPQATEFLDPIVPQYIADLISWAAIGARTTESQTHREMASGLSMPVGFKNSTDGSFEIALDAMTSANHGHSFLGIDELGYTSIVSTKGNPQTHLILRGGSSGSNYHPEQLAKVKESLKFCDKLRPIMIDCSHGNSEKDFRKQSTVWENVVSQYRSGNNSILGLMLESHLVEGKQSLVSPALVYGQSITDGCISFETTEKLLSL